MNSTSVSVSPAASPLPAPVPARTYGYVRVSSVDQNAERQLLAMRRAEVPEGNIYADRQSGGDFHRPGYRRLVRKLRPGDLLYIKSIDRLGRNYEEIQVQWRVLTREKGADICVLDMPLLDTRRGKDLMGTFLSDIVLQLLSFVAENERTNIRARQAEGIAAARGRGVKFGRPRKPLPAGFPEARRAYRAGAATLKDAARSCGMAPTTFYEAVARVEAETEAAGEAEKG